MRGVRFPDALWDALKAKAADEGTTVSEVLRELAEGWVTLPPR